MAGRAAALALLVPLALTGCLRDVLGPADPTPRDYLSDDDYTSWVIEVDYAQGERPPDSVLGLLKSRLEAVVRKPGGIEVRVDDELPRDERAWSTDDLLGLRRRHQDAETGGRTVVTHVAFLAGHSAADGDGGRVLGVTVGHGQVAIFSQTIKDSCSVTAFPPCFYADEQIFNAVTVHEFGHVLGLVNAGTPMVRDHQDEAHGAHSDNPQSVMYWAVESTDFLQFLTNGLPTEFDADDRADLKANGGR